MNEPASFQVSDDFSRVYDNRDPRTYFQALRPLDYRMPGIVAGFLGDNRELLCQALSTTRPRLLDFACGYGAVAALLRHDLTLDELYAHYAAGDWSLEADAALFARHRRVPSPFEIGGLDIAGNALAYAIHCGLVDHVFDDDLLAGPAGAGLRRFLRSTDVIYESGAVLDILMPVLLDLIDAASDTRPWLLVAPRRDVDDAVLVAGLEARDYVMEIVNPDPIRYRKSLGKREREQHAEKIRALGRDPASGMEGDYIVLDLRLARPRDAVGRYPVEIFNFIG